MNTAPRLKLLTTDKQLHRPVLWRDEIPYLAGFQHGRFCIYGVAEEHGSWIFPDQHQPGSQWMMLREDWQLTGDSFLYVNRPDGKIWHWQLPVPSAGSKTPVKLITSIQPQLSAGCPQYHQQTGYAWIEEPKADIESAPITSKSKICLLTKPEAEQQIIAQNHDYYRNLRWAPDGQSLAYIGWNRSQLAWQADELIWSKLTADGAATNINIANFSPTTLIGINQLVMLENNRLLVVARDQNAEALYLFDEASYTWQRLNQSTGRFYSRAPWGLWEPLLASCPARDSVFAITRSQGSCQLEEFFLNDTSSQRQKQFLGWSFLKNLSLSPTGSQLYLEGASWRQPLELLHQQIPADHPSASTPIGPRRWLTNADRLSPPQAFQWQSQDHESCHGLFYPSHHRSDKIGQPLLVLIHSGPYQEVYRTWPLKAHYFNQLGYAVAYLNFSGSSGYGWQYCERLTGQWGQRDTQDIISAVKHLTRHFPVDAKQIILWGGAAGGFSVLNSLSQAPDLFAAGIVVYPFIDLQKAYLTADRSYQDYLQQLLAKDWDKFSSADVWTKLSRIRSPLAIFHGKQDQRIPWQQSQRLAEQLTTQGCKVFTRFYEDLGHLWSDKASLIRYYQDVEKFLKESGTS